MKIIVLFLSFLFCAPAFAQTFSVNNLIAQSATINAPSPLSGATIRTALSTAPTLYVDQTAGVNSSSCGLSTGAAACQTIQAAVNRLCGSYDIQAADGSIPTIMLAPGETYTSGLDMQASDATSPVCVGIHEIQLEGNGGTATINAGSSTDIYLRYVPMLVRLSNLDLENGGAASNLIFVRGGGSIVEMNGGMTFGAVGSATAQMLASDDGYITDCPSNVCGATSYTISGGGGFFAQAIAGGEVALEGKNVSFNSGITYQQAVLGGDSNGIITLNTLTWSGTNPTGLNYIMQAGSVLKTAAQTGSFGACAGNTYLPGTSCGQLYYGANIDMTGTPTVTGAGSGATVQGVEPAFNIILGSGLSTTAGTLVGPIVVTMATATDYRSCIVQSNDPGSVSNPYAQWTQPSGVPPSVTNGYADIYYTATTYSSSGKALWVQCH